jgi:hypothetical protein
MVSKDIREAYNSAVVRRDELYRFVDRVSDLEVLRGRNVNARVSVPDAHATEFRAAVSGTAIELININANFLFSVLIKEGFTVPVDDLAASLIHIQGGMLGLCCHCMVELDLTFKYSSDWADAFNRSKAFRDETVKWLEAAWLEHVARWTQRLVEADHAVAVLRAALLEAIEKG